jgi:hypothetical protein
VELDECSVGLTPGEQAGLLSLLRRTANVIAARRRLKADKLGKESRLLFPVVVIVRYYFLSKKNYIPEQCSKIVKN